MFKVNNKDTRTTPLAGLLVIITNTQWLLFSHEDIWQYLLLDLDLDTSECQVILE